VRVRLLRLSGREQAAYNVYVMCLHSVLLESTNGKRAGCNSVCIFTWPLTFWSLSISPLATIDWSHAFQLSARVVALLPPEASTQPLPAVACTRD